jgi:hypothetical protein
LNDSRKAVDSLLFLPEQAPYRDDSEGFQPGHAGAFLSSAPIMADALVKAFHIVFVASWFAGCSTCRGCS